MSARLEKFTFTENQEAVVNNELVIPVPDGYQYYSESEEGIGTRLLVITPEGYPRSTDPFDAEFAMVIPQYATVGVPFDPEKAEPYKFIFTSNYPVFTDGVIVEDLVCRENFGILHQNFYNEDDPTWNKVLAMIFVNSGAYIAHIYFNHPGYNALDGDLIDHFVSDVDEWMEKFRLTTESPASSVAIPSTTPDKSLYSRYSQVAQMSGMSSAGFNVVVNAAGADYQFIPFSQASEDDEVSDDSKSAYQRIINADSKGFSLSNEADKMKSLFRVSPSAFNMKHDRECEIDEGYIYKDYMLIALRSFAWTLAAYCAENGKTPADLSTDELKAIVDYCEKKEWLNFDNISYCKGLCDNNELHIFYVPDSAAVEDKKRLEPTQEDYDRVESMRRSFPTYNEILDQVRSLDSLRSDLEYIYPAMAAFYNMLGANRNRDEELTGSIADILYAWCAITKAAKEPFYVEDGPMRCFFTQLDGALETPELSIPQKTNNSDSHSTDDKNKKHDSESAGYMDQGCIVLSSSSADVDSADGELIKYHGNAVKIYISDEFQSIADYAFCENESIEEVVVSSGVKSIGEQAFWRCNRLKSVTLQNGVETICDSAFGSCKNLKSVILPESLLEIEDTAFMCCTELESIDLPQSLTSIGEGAFLGCSKLKAVNIPSSVRYIGAYPFNECKSLKYLYIPATVEEFGDNWLEDLNDFWAVIHIEKGSPAEKAVLNCSEADKYMIVYEKPSDSVIEEHFKNPFGFSDTEFTIEDEVLVGVETAEERIIIPAGIKRISQKAFEKCGKVKEIVISEGVVEIEDNAFSNAKTLQRVFLPSTLETLGKMSLLHELTEINIPEKIKEIPDNCFWWCSNLKQIVLPHGLLRIGKGAFRQTAIEEIDIPDSVTSIEECVFEDCVNLKRVSLSKKTAKIGESAFSNTLITEIALPDTIKSIGNNAFKGCKHLRTVKLPTGLKKIPDSAFWECEELDNIVLGDKVTSIGEYAFSGCKKLSSISIPKSVTKIEDQAFSDCISLQRIVIPNSVTKLGDWTFSNCDSLEDIYIPSSVKSFGEFALLFGSYETRVHVIKGSPVDQFCQDNWISNIVYETEQSMKSYQ